MYTEPRPTCVTVIGWMWMILGGFMVLSSLFGAVSHFMMQGMLEQHPQAAMEVPGIFRWLPLLVVAQVCASGLGVYAGRAFLQCRAGPGRGRCSRP